MTQNQREKQLHEQSWVCAAIASESLSDEARYTSYQIVAQLLNIDGKPVRFVLLTPGLVSEPR